MNKYIEKVLNETKEKNKNEKEFLQTVEEVLTSLEPIVSEKKEYEKEAILERIVEPERVIEFRVPWEADDGKIYVNRGYRVQFSGAIGPYKGGLRFSKTVNLSIIKFLGFEQIFKNSLTTMPIGGGKGGSDFDPKGKSDREIMRFCQSFMQELYRHIGADIDCPAGDIGVGGREIGYLFGEYRKITGSYSNGALSGKAINYGGSLLRPEATGYGAIYYLCEVLKDRNDDINGKTIAMSGYGNVAWGIAKKVKELGGKVITFSGSDGFVYDKDGLNTDEKIDYIYNMRVNNVGSMEDYAKKYRAEFYKGKKPWGVKADIYMPAATQNEVGDAEAKEIINSGTKYYFEVSNMPTTNEAIEILKNGNILVAPSKAVNAGGVAVSALEMSQNAEKLFWTKEEVDNRLKQIMKDIYNNSKKAADKYGLGYDLIKGANIAGFEKVAESMLMQGIAW